MTGARSVPRARAAAAGGREVASKATVIVFSKTFAHLSRVAAIVVLARILPKTDFGALSFVLLTYVAVAGLAQVGLPESVYFFFEKLPRESRGRFVLLVARMLLLFGLAAAAVLVLVSFLAEARGHDVAVLFLPLTILPLLELPTMPVTHVLIASDRARSAAWMNILFSGALFAALVAPPVLGLSVAAIPWGLLAYGTFRLAASAAVFLRHFRRDVGSLPPGTAGALLSYSLPLGVAQVIWKLNQVVDKYVVMYFLPMAVFAEYSVGSWEIPFVPMVANAVAAVMMPRFVAAYLEGRRKDLLAAWSAAVGKVSIVVLPLMVLFIVVARELIVVLFTERYLAAVLPFQIYTLILFQRVASYDAVLRAMDRTRVVTVWAAATIAVNLALSVPLVLLLGMVGAALSTLLANAATWVYVLRKIGSALEVGMAEVFPFPFYGRVLTVSILAAIPAALLGAVPGLSDPLVLGGKLAVYVGSYALMATAAGVCGREEWEFLRSLVRLPRAPRGGEGRGRR